VGFIKETTHDPHNAKYEHSKNPLRHTSPQAYVTMNAPHAGSSQEAPP
jgi:hypothetical protein